MLYITTTTTTVHISKCPLALTPNPKFLPPPLACCLETIHHCNDTVPSIGFFTPQLRTELLSAQVATPQSQVETSSLLVEMLLPQVETSQLLIETLSLQVKVSPLCVKTSVSNSGRNVSPKCSITSCSNHEVHLVAAPELSMVSNHFYQQTESAQLLWNQISTFMSTLKTFDHFRSYHMIFVLKVPRKKSTIPCKPDKLHLPSDEDHVIWLNSLAAKWTCCFEAVVFSCFQDSRLNFEPHIMLFLVATSSLPSLLWMLQVLITTG